MARIALAQVNPTIGDLAGNTAIVGNAIKEAESLGADVVALPELVITGYPPDDLLLKKCFLEDSQHALESIAKSTGSIAAVVGCVQCEHNRLYSAAALLHEGRIRAVYRKHCLPNYGVFDERRFFQPGRGLLIGKIAGLTLGITVCEDLWLENGPHVACVAAGAGMIININASPYHLGKPRLRSDLLASRARQLGVAIAYVNCVGGGDEVVFDGQSCAVDAGGALIARAGQFSEELLVFDLDPGTRPSGSPPALRPPAEGTEGAASRADEPVTVMDLASRPRQDAVPYTATIAAQFAEEPEIYAALLLGVRDYLRKNGFHEVLVGISGGIDSALTAAIAVDAVGARRVLGISNPSEFTSARSAGDAQMLAGNLGFRLVTLPIGTALTAMRQTLAAEFAQEERGVADQNLQARIRGTLWMAVSNMTGRLVLATGNKSELAVGYATLYGDMAGGFAVLKDVPKTLVYRLARWRNTLGEVIPQPILERPPTAELAPGQLDTDSLPPYEILDPILRGYVENDLCVDEIARLGYDRETVRSVAEMVDRAEYKRRQAAPGIKITARAFGRDRRLPITNRYRPR